MVTRQTTAEEALELEKAVKKVEEHFEDLSKSLQINQTVAPIYKRVILKITGEAFANENAVLNMHAAEKIAEEIERVCNLGIQMGIVIGGGNIIRGRNLQNIDRASADYMGMMATAINSVFLQEILEKRNITTRTQTAIEMKAVAEPYIPRRAIRHMEKGRIVILACGTGHPFCSTDYTAVLRALELKADAILKGTKVDGLYEKYPPPKNSKPIASTSYQIAKNLNLGEILDNAALGLMMDGKKSIPLHIFNIFKKRNLACILLGSSIGSKIC